TPDGASASAMLRAAANTAPASAARRGSSARPSWSRLPITTTAAPPSSRAGNGVRFGQLMTGIAVARPGRGRPRTRPDYVLADKGYSSRANRELLRRRGIAHTIPEPSDQQANRARRGSRGGRPVGFDKDRYRRRNTVERGFCQLKHWRGLATRYDRHARNYLGALHLAALLTWLP